MKPRRIAKAYKNERFLLSSDARVIRMLSEYLEPLQRFRRLNVRDTVVVFGSARAREAREVRRELDAARRARRPDGQRVRKLESQLELARYYDEAMEFGRLITDWGKRQGPGLRYVICSGGGPGIMEAANRGATERAGGKSIGLAISLPFEEAANPYITPELAFEFHYFFMRKLWFIYLASALVVFPGGFGTFDELFEVLTLVQTRKITRPLPIVLYGAKFWREVVDFDALVRWGTIAAEDKDLFRICDTPREAFETVRRALQRHYRRPTRAIDPNAADPVL